MNYLFIYSIIQLCKFFLFLAVALLLISFLFFFVYLLVSSHASIVREKITFYFFSSISQSVSFISYLNTVIESYRFVIF